MPRWLGLVCDSRFQRWRRIEGLRYTQTMTIATATPALEGGLYRFTLEEFERLSDLGFFGDLCVELLNGALYVKGKTSPKHAQVTRNLTERFILALNNQVFVSPQNPMVLPSPPPDFVFPDVALLKLPKDQYEHRDVTAADALLVIEVSDSTLERDRTEKLAAYARNNVPEYWIINVNTDRLEVHSQPKGTEYTLRHILEPGQPVPVLEFDLQLEWW